jgi:hypothetical protein
MDLRIKNLGADAVEALDERASELGYSRAELITYLTKVHMPKEVNKDSWLVKGVSGHTKNKIKRMALERNISVGECLEKLVEDTIRSESQEKLERIKEILAED